MPIHLNIEGTRYNLQSLPDQLKKWYRKNNIINNSSADKKFQTLLKRIQNKTAKMSFNKFFETHCLDIEILHKENIHNFLIDGHLIVLYKTGDIKFVEYKTKEDNADGARHEEITNGFSEEDMMFFDDGGGLFDEDDNYVAPIPSLSQYFEGKFIPRDIEFVVNGKDMSIAAFQKYMTRIIQDDELLKKQKRGPEIQKTLAAPALGSVVTLSKKVDATHHADDQFVITDIQGNNITIKHGSSGKDYPTTIDNIQAIKLDTSNQ